MRGRTIALLGLTLIWAACSSDPRGSTEQVDGTPTEQIEQTEQFSGTPLTGSKVRTDGFYVARTRGLAYFIRFYPKGNAVLIGGPKDSEKDLKSMIREDAVQGESNIHNVPVTLRNDSILFVTKAMKGEIDYSGAMLTGDSIQFLKHSHINGKRALVTYHFEPV